MPEWVVSLPNRLDSFLAAEGRMLSRAKAQKAIDDGHVEVNDEVIRKSSFRLQEGDTVKVETEKLKMESDESVLPTDQHLPILYEDDACLVIDKPAGLAVHPGAGMGVGEKTLLDGIAYLYQERKLPFSQSSVLVHRLDKETTGCLLVAKNPEAHIRLQEQFADRTVEKHYLALVAGIPSPPAATIDAPIGRSAMNRTKMSVMKATAPREAQTTYKTLTVANNMALLDCEIHTGRTHQIRVHLSTLDHPVLGDSSYSNELSERVAQEFGIQNLCLHAWTLEFDTLNGKRQKVTSLVPHTFAETLKRCGMEIPPVIQ